MLKRYDAIKNEMVELDQEYFDRLQWQFACMMKDYAKHCPKQYEHFCNSYGVKVKDNAN
jgi:hypothetical protein